MAQTTSFYELAALLIPVLMLSGFVTVRLKRLTAIDVLLHPKRSLARWVAVVLFFGFLPAHAEIAALAAVMSGGRVSLFHTWLIALAVALGVWALAVSWVWPWLAAVWRSGGAVRLVVVVLALATIALSTGLLKTSVELQATTSALGREREVSKDPVLSDRTSRLLIELYELQLADLDVLRREGQVSRKTYLQDRRELREALETHLINELGSESQRLEEALGR